MRYKKIESYFPTHRCIVEKKVFHGFYELSIPHGSLVRMIKVLARRKCIVFMVKPKRDRNGQRVVITQLTYFRRLPQL